MEGFAGDLWLFIPGAALFHIAVLHQLLLDLNQIVFAQCDVQGGADGFQMVDLAPGLLGQIHQGLVGALELVVLVEMLFGVVLGGELRVQGDGDFLVGVIVQCLKGSAAFLKSVSIGIDQFTVDLEFIFF